MGVERGHGRAARRLLERLEKSALDERQEAAREEAQKLLLRRHLALLREADRRKEPAPAP